MRTKTPLVLLLLAPACLLATVSLMGQGRVDRDVAFAQEGDACVMTSQPTRIHAKRNFVIVWHVTNRCEREIVVEVGNFTFNGAPVEAPVNTKPATVATGKNQPLFGIIVGDAKTGSYTYEVLLQGGQAEDPELVIDP